MGFNYETVVKDYTESPEDAEVALTEAMQEDPSLTQNFDLGRLFEECFGYGNFRRFRENRKGSVNRFLSEDAAPTTSNAFVNISGQIIYNMFMDVYNNEDYIFKNKIRAIDTPFNGEKIAGITSVGDDGGEIGEGKQYPVAGVSEDYIESPETTKRGLINGITREAIFFNRTGSLLMDRIKDVARAIAVRQEIEAIDAFIDANRTQHRHKWRGTVYASYYALADTGPWTNKVTGTPLADWSSLNAIEVVLSKIVDPNTGLVIMIEPSELVVAQDLLHTARQIITATENRTAVGGYATTGNLSMRVGPSTVDNYDIVSSRLLGSRMDAASISRNDWWLGNIAETVVYMQNWPMEVTTAPAGTEAEFNRDVVMQWKCNRRGEYFVKQPRATGYGRAA